LNILLEKFIIKDKTICRINGEERFPATLWFETLEPIYTKFGTIIMSHMRPHRAHNARIGGRCKKRHGLVDLGNMGEVVSSRVFLVPSMHLQLTQIIVDWCSIHPKNVIW